MHRNIFYMPVKFFSPVGFILCMKNKAVVFLVPVQPFESGFRSVDKGNYKISVIESILFSCDKKIAFFNADVHHRVSFGVNTEEFTFTDP